MSRFKAKPKQTSTYPALLNELDKNRKRNLLKGKLSQQNKSFKALDSRRLQMFSGKRGK